MTIMLSLVVLKEGWRPNNKIKDRPFAEGSRDYSCARAFSFYKTEVKAILRGVRPCQRMVINNSLPPMLNRTLKIGSHRGTITFLFSFVYH